ncbi:MAG: efflux RND transporter periplasmic adaptor subunit [Gammaproteobacteria bacterium]|jgi:HlyD family secretion protein
MTEKEFGSLHGRVAQALEPGSPRPGRRRLYWLLALAVAGIIGYALYALMRSDAEQAVRYVTAEVTRGDLTVTVTATGTVQPVNQVDVGSELSGTVDSVLVDFNDLVTRGQVLARLDTDRLQAAVVEGRAALKSAEAKLEEAKATVVETRLRLQRCETLAEQQMCSAEELATQQAARSRAVAAQTSARAQVAVARASLEIEETNLSKAEIRSPVDGLVLRRQVEPGQTVAASLQAPVLFTLAENLAQMELHVAVDEADIGKVREKQSAVFTVDAYPDREFEARITQVRFAPQTIEGVVTYETLLAVENDDLALRPGMTATAVITVQQLDDVVLVPNAALRFAPPMEQEPDTGGGGLFGSIFRPPHSTRRKSGTTDSGRQVWILRDGQPLAVPVETGPSDGQFTQLRGGEIEPGQAVIVDSVGAAS